MEFALESESVVSAPATNILLPDAVIAMSRSVLAGLRQPDGREGYRFYPEKTVATAAVHQALRLAAASGMELVA